MAADQTQRVRKLNDSFRSRILDNGLDQSEYVPGVFLMTNGFAGLEPRLISGVSGEGVTEVLRAAWGQVRERRTEEKAAVAGPDEGWAP